MKKSSEERDLILESLNNRKDTPTAEKLFMDLKKENLSLGINTVYRILDELCEEGVIIRIKARSGPDKYDACTLPHIHFTCSRCQDVQNIFLYEPQIKRLDNDIKKLTSEYDAIVDTTIIELTGTCKKCSKYRK